MAQRNKPELLAPAGDLERLRAALDYGADAVYLGRESFSMRAAASNFHSAEQLHEAVAFHFHICIDTDSNSRYIL